MTNYKRVLPRDAFNEAKLLKCVGKLTLMIEDGMLPAWHYHYDGDAFNIVQDESDGSISIGNITFWRNKKQVHVMTGLNSKENWPALMRDGDDDYYIFDEKGNYMPSDIPQKEWDRKWESAGLAEAVPRVVVVEIGSGQHGQQAVGDA